MKTNACNANVVIQKAFYPLSSNLKDLPVSLELLIQIEDFKSTLFLPLSSCNASGIQKNCPLVLFKNKKERDKFDAEFISSLIQGLKDGSIQHGYYFEKVGTTIFPDGHICFLRGSELIGKCDRPYLLSPEIRDMDLLHNCAPMSKLISTLLASPKQVLPVFSYVILSSIRSLLIENDVNLQAVLYIVGKQGLGKTTLATKIAGIYEREKKTIGIVQAGSTHASVNSLLSTLRDQPVIIDDLCLSASRTTTRKCIELASKLIRQGTGHIPITKKMGNTNVELPCEASLIMTAEFHLENLSDLTRCIIVPIQKPLNLPPELTPELIGNAIRHFSLWFTQHESEEIARFRNDIAASADKTIDTRMSTNYICIKTALESFLCSLDENDLSTTDRDRILKNMDSALKQSKKHHENMIAEVKESIPIGNISFCILEGYRNGAFNLAKHKKDLDKCGGIKWKGDLCLKSSELISFVRQQPGYHNWSSRKIVSALKTDHALVIQEEEAATVHLEEKLPRVYRIRIKVLKQTAKKF